jgi:hypothetical protein
LRIFTKIIAPSLSLYIRLVNSWSTAYPSPQTPVPPCPPYSANSPPASVVAQTPCPLHTSSRTSARFLDPGSRDVAVHGHAHVGVGGGAMNTCHRCVGMMASARIWVAGGGCMRLVAGRRHCGVGIVCGGWGWALRLGGHVCLDGFVGGVGCCMRRMRRCGGGCCWLLVAC